MQRPHQGLHGSYDGHKSILASFSDIYSIKFTRSDVVQIMRVLVVQNIYLFAAETRASRAALAARRASHAEASCSAKRTHSSMAPPQVGLRRSSSGGKSQRPQQQARTGESPPGTAGEELVDATMVSHEIIGPQSVSHELTSPQPVSHELIGPQPAVHELDRPQRAASPYAMDQDRAQPAELQDAAQPSRSAGVDIPATASRPDQSSHFAACEGLQDGGHESTGDAEPAAQSASLHAADQLDSVAPGNSSPSSRQHIALSDQSEPPDPGDSLATQYPVSVCLTASRASVQCLVDQESGAATEPQCHDSKSLCLTSVGIDLG